MSDKSKADPHRAPYLIGFRDILDDNTGNRGDDRSDYRAVPQSDSGNDSYDDRGMLGFYQTDAQPFEDPPGVKHFTGYGADEADLKRGWRKPGITQNPAYQLSNYKDRSSSPKESDVTPGNLEVMQDDWEFRNRNRTARGFLTRPRIPTER